MRESEKNVLGRLLVILKEAYLSIHSGTAENPAALLDGISAVLPHIGDTKKPAYKLMGSLKRSIRFKNKSVYPKVKPFFSKLYLVNDFDFEKALKHIPAIINGNDRICEKVIRRETDRVKSMCDAMKSYPGFLFGEYEALSDRQFYDLVFGYYPKLYDEDFMGNMKQLFYDE